tara:strand:- start:424 stop:1245 length:822 start_codon:yes stop_codon:yes gene_type:complete
MNDANIKHEGYIVEKFLKDGYLVVNLFTPDQIEIIKTLIRQKITNIYKDFCHGKINKNWALEKYHKTLGVNEKTHATLMENPVRYFFMPENLIKTLTEQPLKQIMQHFWGHLDPLITHIGHEKEKNKPVSDNACCFRVIRPGSQDASGVHVDTYYAAKRKMYIRSLNERLNSSALQLDLLSSWVPIIGFSEKYSLRLSPGSHVIKHPPNSFIKSPNHITRIVKKDYEKQFNYVRPRLKKGQAIIFHPNTLHGGSTNFGQKTRVSVEVRFRNNK